MVIIPEDKDIVEIIELEFFQTEGQFDRRRADQDRHFGRLFHLDIMEVFGMLEEIGAEEKFPLFFQTEPVIIPEMPGHDGMIKGFAGNKMFELVPVVKMLKKHSDRAIQK